MCCKNPPWRKFPLIPAGQARISSIHRPFKLWYSAHLQAVSEPASLATHASWDPNSQQEAGMHKEAQAGSNLNQSHLVAMAMPESSALPGQEAQRFQPALGSQTAVSVQLNSYFCPPFSPFTITILSPCSSRCGVFGCFLSYKSWLRQNGILGPTCYFFSHSFPCPFPRSQALCRLLHTEEVPSIPAHLPSPNHRLYSAPHTSAGAEGRRINVAVNKQSNNNGNVMNINC